MRNSSSWRQAQTRYAEEHPGGGSKLAVATGVWLLVSLVAIGFGIALLTGIVHDTDQDGGSAVAQGLAFIGAAIVSNLAYYFLVIRRLGRR